MEAPPSSCNLLTDSFAKVVQLLLGFVAVGTLFVKRELESPKRPFHIWFLDVSKQGIGAMMLHLINIFLSMLFAHSNKQDVDECGVYFITFFIDATFGTFIVGCCLNFLEQTAKRMNWSALVESGKYGNPPSYIVWGKQFLCYLSTLVLMKLIVSFIIWLAFDFLAKLATSMFSIFSHHRHLELLVVMIFGPCLLNSFQFWIIDSIIKRKSDPGFDAVPVDDCDEEKIKTTQGNIL